ESAAEAAFHGICGIRRPPRSRDSFQLLSRFPGRRDGSLGACCAGSAERGRSFASSLLGRLLSGALLLSLPLVSLGVMRIGDPQPFRMRLIASRVIACP